MFGDLMTQAVGTVYAMFETPVSVVPPGGTAVTTTAIITEDTETEDQPRSVYHEYQISFKKSAHNAVTNSVVTATTSGKRYKLKHPVLDDADEVRWSAQWLAT